jgi:hypothetical protein
MAAPLISLILKKESMIGAKHIVLSVKSEERFYALIFDDEVSPHGVIFCCYFVYKSDSRDPHKTNQLEAYLQNLRPARKSRQRFFPLHHTGWSLASTSFYCAV